jgi:hypothetical protein
MRHCNRGYDTVDICTVPKAQFDTLHIHSWVVVAALTATNVGCFGHQSVLVHLVLHDHVLLYLGLPVHVAIDSMRQCRPWCDDDDDCCDGCCDSQEVVAMNVKSC